MTRIPPCAHRLTTGKQQSLRIHVGVRVPITLQDSKNTPLYLYPEHSPEQLASSKPLCEQSMQVYVSRWPFRTTTTYPSTCTLLSEHSPDPLASKRPLCEKAMQVTVSPWPSRV